MRWLAITNVAAGFVPPRRFEATLALDRSRRAGRWTGLVVNNTVHLANFPAFHDARPDDGMLDVMEQDFRWPRQLLQNAEQVSAVDVRCLPAAAHCSVRAR